MKSHLKYLSYVLRHKWFVFLACRELGIPWLGIIHDWSKFRPDEWVPYVKYFYERPGTVRDESGYYKPYDTGAPDFDYAWLLHQKRNKHHWQWWVLPCDEDGVKVLPIPDKYRREMLADWKGAGQAQGTPNTAHWYTKNSHKLQLHPETRDWIEEQIWTKKS